MYYFPLAAISFISKTRSHPNFFHPACHYAVDYSVSTALSWRTESKDRLQLTMLYSSTQLYVRRFYSMTLTVSPLRQLAMMNWERVSRRSSKRSLPARWIVSETARRESDF